MQFTGTDLIVVIGAIGAALATVVSAYVHRRSGEDNDVEQMAFRLHPDDRSLMVHIHEIGVSLRDTLLSVGRRSDQLTDSLVDHRRAVEDNTAEMRRGRG